MTYVDLLESVAFPGQSYVGHTDDLRRRLADHNAGKSPHTAKYKPWRLVTYIAFSDEGKAIAFERYLKPLQGALLPTNGCDDVGLTSRPLPWPT